MTKPQSYAPTAHNPARSIESPSAPTLTSAEPALLQPTAPARRRRGGVIRWVRARLGVVALQLLALVILLGAWQLSASQGLLNVTYVSEPSRFIPAFWSDLTTSSTLSLLKTTLYETLVGFALASVLGVVAGVALAEWALLDAVFRPFLTAFNNIPRIALAPLFVLWFGLGSLSRIVLVVSLGFFVVAFNTYAGVQSGGRDYLLLARTLGASRLVKFRKFVFPSALPSIFAGLQLCLTYAFLGAVVGEMLAGSQGLGGFLALKIGTFDTDAFFGGLLLLVFVSLIVSSILRMLEHWLLRWRTAELGGISSKHRNT